jgi:hypothetical protein
LRCECNGWQAFHEKCLLVVVHVLDEINIRIAIVDYVKVWLLLPIGQSTLHLNGKVPLEAINVDHLWVSVH